MRVCASLFIALLSLASTAAFVLFQDKETASSDGVARLAQETEQKSVLGLVAEVKALREELAALRKEVESQRDILMRCGFKPKKRLEPTNAEMDQDQWVFKTETDGILVIFGVGDQTGADPSYVKLEVWIDGDIAARTVDFSNAHRSHVSLPIARGKEVKVSVSQNSGSWKKPDDLSRIRVEWYPIAFPQEVEQKSNAATPQGEG